MEPHFETKKERDRYSASKPRKPYCHHYRNVRINAEIVECLECGCYARKPVKVGELEKRQ